MNSHWFHSLRFQFLATALLLLIILFGGTIFNTNRLLSAFALENTQAIIAQTSEILNLAISPRTATKDLHELESYLNELIRKDGQAITYLVLLDEEGKALIKTPDTPNQLPDPDSSLEEQIANGLIHVSQPILIAENRVGQLRFGFSTEQIKQAQKNIILNNLLLLIGGLIFSSVITFLIGNRINRQFTHLIKASQALAAGELNVRALESGENELSDLARNFNFMADAVVERTVALQESEAKLRAMFDGAQDGILVVNIETKQLINANPSLCTMTGYGLEELLTLNVMELHPDLNLALVLKQYESQTQEKTLITKEINVKRKDDSLLSADISISRLSINGQIYIAEFFRDVTDRKRIDNELQTYRVNLEKRVAERTAKLEKITAYNRMLFELSPIGLALCRMDGSLMDVNPAFLSIIGYTEIEAKALSYWDITPQDYANQEKLQLESLAQTGRYGPYDKEYLHKLGHRVPVRLSGLLIEEDGQQFIWSSVEDITDEKTNQQKLETIIENLPSVFFTKDVQGRHLMINRRYEEAVGINKALAIGKTDLDIFPLEIAKTIIAVDQRVLNEKQSFTFEESIPHPDGSLHDYLTTKVPLINDRGEAFILIGMATDITPLKKLQHELALAKDEAEHLMHIKTDFLSNMSHEIRTPLNAVLGLAKIGARDSLDMESRTHFNQILNSGKHLLSLLNDILDFSKLEAGKLTIEKHSFDLHNTIDTVIKIVSEQAQIKGLTLSATIAPEIPAWVEGDSLRLRQILLNILTNSIKFTQRGKIKLSVDKQGVYTCFKITDTGIGMTKEQLSRLFSPFEQGDKSTTRKFGGSGLGLAISQDLAILMAGNITVESEPNKGSAFTLNVPLPEVTPDCNYNSQPPETENYRLRNIRVLVAEDIEMNRYILEDLLKHEGAQAIFAENGQQAIDHLEKMGTKAFDIVLMDIQMPIMDGYEATRRIREITPKLPIIGLTAHALSEEKNRSLNAGMVDHVTKPIDVDILVKTIQKHLNQPNLSKSNTPLATQQTPSSIATINETIPLDSLPGIDLEDGINRFRGKWPFYTKMLLLFRNQYQSAGEKMALLLAQTEFKDARMLAHSLKSSAGNIGAMELQKVAATMELACRNCDSQSATEQLTAFCVNLEEVLSGLNKLDKN